MPLQVHWLLAVVFAVLPSSLARWCVAQPPDSWAPPDAETLEAEGTIVGVVATGLHMLTKEHNVPWVVQITRQSDVLVTGTAEPSFLRPGLVVQFTGEVDDKGHLQQDLAELEVVTTSGKNAIGVFGVGADENAKPIGKLTAGTYDIRGKIISLRDGALTVQAGKKIVGKLAADAKIAVNARDLTFAQPDDEVTVKGFYFRRFAPNTAQQRPGQAMGKEVRITLAKPLAGKVKTSAKPSKTSKPNPGDSPDPILDDPFGLEKEKK